MQVLKDITCRYQMLRGRPVSFVPGWDCHGLPIEHKAAAKLAAADAPATKVQPLPPLTPQPLHHPPSPRLRHRQLARIIAYAT